MKCLRLDDSAAEMYEQRPEIVRELMNVYRSPSDGNLYHLLPDHLNEVEDGATEVIICAACSATLKKGMVPKFSLASGYDFGRLDMLEPLSLLEKIVVSPYRTFATILKLKPSRGAAGRSSQSFLEGYAVMFRHDAVEATVAMFPRHRFV
eukprot:scpid75408/ scgid20489/ 